MSSLLTCWPSQVWQQRWNIYLIHSPDIVWVNANLSCEAIAWHRGANISSFERRLVSLWPSFFLHSQSLHLCRAVSFPLPRAGQDFSVLHPHSISCLVLLLPGPHPSTPARCAAYHPPPPTPPQPPAHTPPSIQPGPGTNTAFTEASPLTHSSVTHHLVGLYLAFITSQHLGHHRTGTHQQNIESNQPHSIP